MKKLVIKMELRALEVRSLCIRKNYYTKGDVVAYSKMLDMCGEELTEISELEKLAQTLAEDIVAHSEEREECGKDEFIEYVAFELVNDCLTKKVEYM